MPNFIVGETFLTKEEKARLAEQEQWNLLFDNAYDDLTKLVASPDQVKKEGDDYWLQIGVALPGLISKVSADLLFGEPPLFESDSEDNKKFFDETITDEFLQSLYQGAITQSSEGGVVIKLFTEQGDDAESVVPVIQLLQPKCAFPTFKRFTNIVEMWDLVTIEPKDDETSWMLREHHEVGIVTFETYIIETDSGVIKSQEPDMLEQQTGLDVMPICYLPNFAKLGEFFGRSDYDGVEAIFVAINRRLTQNDHNLHMHGGGKLQGPGEGKGILDQFGRPAKKTSLDYLTIPMTQIGGKFADYKYLQPGLSVQEDLDTIKQLLKFAFLLTDISPDVFGLGEGQADSGKALKLRLLRTLTMVRRKAKLWEIGLRKIIDLSMEIVGITPDYTITFQDGLPTDTQEQIDEVEQMLRSGLITHIDALKAVHGYTDDDAARDLAIIQADNVSKNEALNAGISI